MHYLQNKKARFFNGLTAIDLAEIFNVDVKTIFNWESVKVEPSERHINGVNKLITNINETSTNNQSNNQYSDCLWPFLAGVIDLVPNLPK
ncbi:hypothetical protein [Paenibacillus sp. SN-8-1]|uniref:hypothetical protein n=1 Tax=Paenibacillus sp. SN-8-1 TaxID=3435409 RepID=UPI003D9A758C